MNTTETAIGKRKETIGTMLEKHKEEITKFLPRHIDFERFSKSAIMAVSRDAKLKNCTLPSLYTAVLNAAELGIDFTPAKAQAYLIAYGNVATFMPGYRGLIDLALRGGAVKRIEAHVVYTKDTFDVVYGTESKLIHRPFLDGDPGEIRGAYACAWFADGGTQFEWMKKSELDAIRKRSKAANNGPWVTDFAEMCRKTTVRRIFKYIPSSPDKKVEELLNKALELDNQAIGLATVTVSDSTSRTTDLADMLTGSAYEDAEFDESENQKQSQPEYEQPLPQKEPELVPSSQPFLDQQPLEKADIQEEKRPVGRPKNEKLNLV